MNFSAKGYLLKFLIDRELTMITRLRFFTLICVLSFPMLIRAQGVTTAPIDQALGRSGQKTGDVYKVSFPRTDLRVSVHGLAIKPDFFDTRATNSSNLESRSFRMGDWFDFL
jgi:hypothetical protein